MLWTVVWDASGRADAGPEQLGGAGRQATRGSGAGRGWLGGVRGRGLGWSQRLGSGTGPSASGVLVGETEGGGKSARMGRGSGRRAGVGVGGGAEGSGGGNTGAGLCPKCSVPRSLGKGRDRRNTLRGHKCGPSPRLAGGSGCT